jgi:hypothetical protein
MEPYYKLRTRTDKDERHQIYLIYSNKGIELRIPMPFKVKKTHWNFDTERVKNSIRDDSMNPIDINQELQENLVKIITIITDYRRINKVNFNPDAEYVEKQYYSNNPIKNKDLTFIEYFKEYRDLKKKGVEGKRRIDAVVGDLDDYIGAKKLYLKDIDKDFLDNFVICLYNDNANYTIKKKIGLVKSFLKYQKMKDRNVNEQALYWTIEDNLDVADDWLIMPNRKEIEFLENLNLSHKPHQERVRDKYLIGCYTGLRFEDILQSLKWDCRRVAESGKEYLEVVTRKTGVMVSPPLGPKLEAILNKYDWKIGRISNPKANEYLRDILRDCKCDSFKVNKTRTRISGKKKDPQTKPKWEFIHFHTSRAYFITNALYSGVPINDVMKWSGHKGNFAVFKRYIDREFGDDSFYDRINN